MDLINHLLDWHLNRDDWAVIGIMVTALATVALAAFTFLVWRSSLRIEWFTGSQESYERTRLLAQAGRRNMIWWDPTIAEVPAKAFGPHGTDVGTQQPLYIFMPRDLRKHRTKIFRERPAEWN